jgi:hypothetical protein
MRTMKNSVGSQYGFILLYAQSNSTVYHKTVVIVLQHKDYGLPLKNIPI